MLQEEQPVSFASRALTPTEQRHAQIENERLAIVYACQKFQSLHSGSESGDHPLKSYAIRNYFHKTVNNSFETSAKNVTAAAEMQLIGYLQTCQKMYVADVLSRAALSQTQDLQQCSSTFFVMVHP